MVAADQLTGGDATLAHAAPEGGPPRALVLPVPLGAELHIKYASCEAKGEKTGQDACCEVFCLIRHDHISRRGKEEGFFQVLFSLQRSEILTES